MPEYISREAVMQKFADHVKRSNNSDFAPTPTWNQAVQIVEDIPAADVVEVRHGRWKHQPGGDSEFDAGDFFRCDRCGSASWEDTDYCPNCGAKMDGGQGDE